ncbi:Sel1-repeat containing protein [Chondrus crispus]|uniref:Sel1-repeat containing protein n=1 Tax=Chondrus crispus TaxID=2769 RepID=R7QEZ2_CHOCR|nr:Sel1-repeat containing protein [Chondrus crispus]CDF36664.1 Sel1-repeat containing protein [Chondrus crispus]|eukprot:XP_005716483.1 Sel1-repeat containing protein [Chondrus crispus]
MVTKIGELMDCGLALMAGGQVRFMVEKDERWEKRCIGPETTETGAFLNGDEVCTDEIESKSNGVFTTHVRLEEARLAYQFGVPLQEFEHVEQTLTFMGHSLESLRTRLGGWVKGNEDAQARAWRPVLFKSGERKTMWEKVGGLSAELSQTVCERGEKCVLKDRGVQSRLVWELQNIVREGMCGAEGCPSAIRAVALCLLSFPAIEVTRMEGGIGGAGEQQRSREAGEVEIKQGESCVTLVLGSGEEAQDQTGRIKTVELTITAMCAPQQTKLDVRLQYTSEHVHEVSVRLRRGENGAEGVFEWEWWRDAAMGRMEGLKRWQENHEMEAVEFRTSRLPIDSGLRIVDSAVRESGHEFVTWAGWEPFRTKHCKLEVESEKLLVEFAVTRQPGSLAVRNKKIYYSVDRMVGRRRSVGYAEAKRESIRDGCLIVREALIEGTRVVESGTALSNQTEDTKDVIRKAENLIGGGHENFGRAIFLLKVAALERNDIGALCTCVELLRKGGPTGMHAGRTSNLREAAQMIKVFFHAKLHTSLTSTSTRGDDGFEKLFDLFAKLVMEQSCDGVIVDLFVDALEDAIEFDVAGNLRKFHAWIRKAIVCSRKWNQLDKLANFSDLAVGNGGDVKSREAKGDGAGKEAFFSEGKVTECDDMTYDLVGKALLERMISEYATLSSREGIWIVLGTAGQGAPWCARERQYAGSQDENSSGHAMNSLGVLFQLGARGVGRDAPQAKLLYETAIEENENCKAMYNLAFLLKQGAEGVERDAVRSMELYERAIEKGEDVDAMVNLGVLLKEGAEGVERNAVRSMGLYERAIEKGDDVGAMVNLGNLLSEGGEGVERDAVRCMELYERAIEKGDHVGAMVNLGVLLEEGAEGVERDAVRCMELYERAIEKGEHVGAMVNLAILLSEGGDGVERDAVRSMELYERAIEKGEDVRAMVNLGNLLKQGAEGVERDAVRSMELYERAIEKGEHVGAMVNLGNLLSEGAEGVERDAVRCMELYERAIEKGDHVGAMVNLGNLLKQGAEGVERDAVRCMELYERAIEKGDHVVPMVNLGVLLQQGAEGVERDAVRSMELYERAIEKGEHVDAMYNLGVLLSEGAKGVERDAVRSMELYERAIEKSEHVGAMVNLAILLQQGAEGVERDAVRSMELYERAIEKGEHVGAMYNLGLLLKQGAEGVERDAVRSMELYERAIEKGDDVDAMVNLGVLLEEGAEGVERDAVRCMELYERAIEKGEHVGAMVNLAILLEEGAEGVERDAVRAVALYDRAMAKGNSGNATCYLAMTLRDGAEGVERNAVRAVELFEMDIKERKQSKSMVCLGDMLRDGADGVARDTDRAIQLYEMAVEEDNNAEAVAQLAALQRDRSDSSTRDEGE